MTSRTRLSRTLGAAALAVGLVLAGGPGMLVLANGDGDLYVATGKQIDEVHTVKQSVINQITAVANPSQLAFSPDGLTLYAANGTTSVTAIDIASLQPNGTYRTDRPVTAMAFPSGPSLYVATQGSATLSVLGAGSTAFIDGPKLQAAPDLLAASAFRPELAAAVRGGTWATVVQTANATLANADKGNAIGKVADMAVARGEGYLWIATTSPNRVAEVDLATGDIIHSAMLDAAQPTAVAAMGNFAVAASGSTLYKIQGNGASTWANAPGKILDLAADRTGTVLYAATADKVIAYNAADLGHPTIVPINDNAPLSLAPVPNRDSSVATVAADPVASGDGGASATGAPRPAKTRAPATDTPASLVAGGRSVDLVSLALGLGALVVVVTLGTRLAIKRLISG